MADYRDCEDCGSGEFYVIGRRVVCKCCSTTYGIVTKNIPPVDVSKLKSRLVETSFDEMEGGK